MEGRVRVATDIAARGVHVDEPEGEWLDLDPLVRVSLTSEDPDHPIEQALLPGMGSGWRAAGPGTQTIRLTFEPPQALHRIWLEFLEPDAERAQEYVLRWSVDGRTFTEIVRQQWNFSPQGAIRETEDHRVDLHDVSLLELTITPDRSEGVVPASLSRLRLA